MLKLTVAGTLLLVCSPALAQAQAAAQPAQQPAQIGIVFDDSPAAGPKVTSDASGKAKSKGRLICQDVGETGSRLAKQRVCMTADQWKDQIQRDRDLLADTQRNTTAVGSNQ